jgi:hypothetical protein
MPGLSVCRGWVDCVQRISRVDCGYASFLPLCPDCPWRGLPRASRAAAAEVADRHAVSVHGDRRARDAASLRDRRLVAS